MPTEDYGNCSDCDGTGFSHPGVDCERCNGTGSHTGFEDESYESEPYLGDDRIFSGFWDEYEPEPDYGGAFDGFTVSSDADSGL